MGDYWSHAQFVKLPNAIYGAPVGDCGKRECDGWLSCHFCSAAPVFGYVLCLRCMFRVFLEPGIKAQRQYLSNKKRRARDPKWGAPAGSDHFWQRYAHSVVKRAIDKGLLPNLSSGEYACVDCGGVATRYEHRDYGRPLFVEPVCNGCNVKRGTAKWPSASDFNFKRITEHV